MEMSSQLRLPLLEARLPSHDGAVLGGCALPQPFGRCMRTGGYGEIASEAAEKQRVDR